MTREVLWNIYNGTDPRYLEETMNKYKDRLTDEDREVLENEGALALFRYHKIGE